MENLWGFKKTDLRVEIRDSPHAVIKEQIEHFDKNTNDLLLGKMTSKRYKSEECEYPLATSFEIVAPSLDGYSCILFTMYNKPESDYPVLIFKRDTEIDDPTNACEDDADYICKNREEFIDNLRKILGSESTLRIIQALYSKSNL